MLFPHHGNKEKKNRIKFESSRKHVKDENYLRKIIKSRIIARGAYHFESGADIVHRRKYGGEIGDHIVFVDRNGKAAEFVVDTINTDPKYISAKRTAYTQTLLTTVLSTVLSSIPTAFTLLG